MAKQKTGTSANRREAKKRPTRLRAAAAKKFLARYKEAWETRNADLASNLFTRDAHYWENPFGHAIVGREAIRAYWKGATDAQDDIHFTVTNSFHHAYTLVAEWTCTFKRQPVGEQVELAGMMFADFYGDQVRIFREYWQRRVK